MRINPKRLAVEYYFGDLQYWKLPRIAADALEEGYDGPASRSLAGMLNPVESDMRTDEIARAFREMGVDAPISKENARLALAIESVQKALNGQSNVFDEATYIRISLCELSDPPDTLRSIVNLSREAKNAPRYRWSRIESDLKDAFSDFLMCQKTLTP
jgi:hypothetical protein